MNTIMIGLDIAKSVFQVHGEDASGTVVLCKRLGRPSMESFFAKLPPATIGIEACGSSHHWGRVLSGLGHTVRLLPAAYVKPFVKRNKTDARDAAAICEAMQRPGMRFVTLKSCEQQAARGIETARDLLVRQRTQLMNAMRGMLAEFGVVAAQGLRGFAVLRDIIDAGDAAIPTILHPALRGLLAQWRAASEQVEALEAQLVRHAQADPTMRRLMTVPGIGPLTAHAIVAAIGDGRQFGSARDFAAWVGLTPREQQSANKRRLGHISRKGDPGVRRLLTHGASAVMRQVRAGPQRGTAWMYGILARRPVKVAVVAQAAKTARIAWAILRSGETYRGAAVAAV
ncbi:IS110 family RNA-guided transposase [Acidiphilium iwatense]|uniref:IS110 family transposase n=1 Tax=Acidiphilium iwatense TaxID=768198 RepID=A0ABS9E4Z6_9PROT|nr:IS110 family transposase [Acidiphilium iwatense]MCF3948687.1 IS110 family transposase [Acidiphilium iwatense]